MQKRILPIAFPAVVLFSLFNLNCTKLDTTDIGSDLLPAVDNVNTFADTLLINTTQGLFSDSTYINRTEDFALGAINYDPLFGTTSAHIFMQLKPPFYPYYLGNAMDTITGPGLGLDSIVLCIKYKGFWGDSTTPVHLEVREVNDITFGIDSINKSNPSNYQPTLGAVLGSADIDVTKLGNYIKFSNGRDSVRNQIRIKLNQSWANQLFGRDSIAANASNNAFYSDSIYRRFYNGIAVMASGIGNGLMYANIADTATKIEIHYKRKNKGKIDSVYTSLILNSTFTGPASNKPLSNTVNNIIRNRTGARISSPTPDELFLQAAPGSYVNLNIPGIAGLSNRIIHRAEIIIEQIPTDPVLDEKLYAPNFLYIDLKDTGTNKWKPVYFDLSPSQSYDPDFTSGNYFLPLGNPSIDFNYFGGYKRRKADLFGNQITYYNFNISRHVQQIVTKRTYNYDLRLYAPFNLIYPQYSGTYVPFSNNIALGRVRIGSGSNPNYKMKLRIVYSKL